MPEALYLPLALVLALLLDRCLGEPRRAHPLVGFGALAARIEHYLNRGPARRLRGVLGWALLVLPPVIAIAWLRAQLVAQQPLLALALDCLVLYLAIGWRSMREHVDAVQRALAAADLSDARRAVGYIVSRNTERADEAQLLTATVESSLENSADALFASLFWFAVAGAPGVVLHRLANTLDAMWGYRSERFERFGWWAARSDDALAFIPSQLLALSFVLLRARAAAWRSWWQQGWRYKSINAGSVMASGAAALGLQLGGEAVYHGQLHSRPSLGSGRAPQLQDLARVFTLVRQAWLLWLVMVAALSLALHGCWL